MMIPFRVGAGIREHARAFTTPELLIMIVLVILLAAVAIPNFIKARTTASKSACLANLLQIEGAKQQWALENKLTNGTPANVAEINKYLVGGVRPNCPANGTYTYRTVGQKAICSLGSTVPGHSL